MVKFGGRGNSGGGTGNSSTQGLGADGLVMSVVLRAVREVAPARGRGAVVVSKSTIITNIKGLFFSILSAN